MLAEAYTSPFADWDNFYVIVGSSAGALTGLQFVVMTLVAEFRPPGSARAVNAFGTPTVVNFSATLLVSAILAAPWHRLGSAGVALAVCGVLGCLYSGITIRRVRQTESYRPTFDDWFWYVALPFIAYVDLLIAALWLQHSPAPAMFAIAGAALALIFAGIRNAWDTVVFLALSRDDQKPPPERKG